MTLYSFYIIFKQQNSDKYDYICELGENKTDAIQRYMSDIDSFNRMYNDNLMYDIQDVYMIREDIYSGNPHFKSAENYTGKDTTILNTFTDLDKVLEKLNNVV